MKYRKLEIIRIHIYRAGYTGLVPSSRYLFVCVCLFQLETEYCMMMTAEVHTS